MWKKITIQERDFVIRISSSANSYEIMLTEFSKVWFENLTEDQLLKRCKELNPLYEAEANVLIKRALDLLNPEEENIKKELLEVGNQLTINFSSYLKGFIFKFSLVLSLTTPEKFCQSLTFPLIQIIEELQERQSTLCDLLKKKDVEINEYKMEGAQLTRKNVVTKPFNENEFLEIGCKDREERALTNLYCPFSFFVKSCAAMYEECVKQKKVAEVVLSPKKNQHDETQIKKEETIKPETSKRRRGNDVTIYDDGDDDDDETYFPVREDEVKPTIKIEPKNTAHKRKMRLNL